MQVIELNVNFVSTSLAHVYRIKPIHVEDVEDEPDEEEREEEEEERCRDVSAS